MCIVITREIVIFYFWIAFMAPRLCSEAQGLFIHSWHTSSLLKMFKMIIPAPHQCQNQEKVIRLYGYNPQYFEWFENDCVSKIDPVSLPDLPYCFHLILDGTLWNTLKCLKCVQVAEMYSAAQITGKPRSVNYGFVPRCLFSSEERVMV